MCTPVAADSARTHLSKTNGHILVPLGALSHDTTAAVLVASNCDHPPRSWQINHKRVEEVCNELGGIEAFQTSISSPETHKRCVSIMLRNVMLARRGMVIPQSRPAKYHRNMGLMHQRRALPIWAPNEATCIHKHSALDVN